MCQQRSVPHVTVLSTVPAMDLRPQRVHVLPATSVKVGQPHPLQPMPHREALSAPRENSVQREQVFVSIRDN